MKIEGGLETWVNLYDIIYLDPLCALSEGPIYFLKTLTVGQEIVFCARYKNVLGSTYFSLTIIRANRFLKSLIIFFQCGDFFQTLVDTK